MNREQLFSQIEDSTRTWDVIVIGGGATGLGTALEAATRGYQTLLVDGADFAQGTSSRSTKLIHGGVRYLRQGQVSMVRHSLRERGRLFQNAPSIVHPLNFVIPTFRTGRRWYFYAGLKAYDWLAGRLNPAPTRLLNARQTADLLPTLDVSHLKGGVMYCDGQFDDAALAIAIASTAAQHGATLVNYAPVVRLLKEADRLSGVVVRDVEGHKEYEVRGKVVVNATGVFAGSILALDRNHDAGGTSQPKITPSQGTHIVLSRDFLPTDNAIMIPDTDDGRILFAIPWLEHTLIGTTDIQVSKVELEPHPQPAEVDYLLEHAGRYLTKKPVRSDVLSKFAGLRPLVAQPGKSTAQLSREHLIDISPSGLISVIGGKWTTYRQMGEEVVDIAAPMAGLANRPSITAGLHLQPAIYETSPDSTEQRLHSELMLTNGQLDHAVKHQWARTIDDVLARRSRALFLNAEAANSIAPLVARRMSSLLGKDEVWEQSQIAAFRQLAEHYS